MFIIVSLGALMAIANMDNKKDTLLYAKFIADVGARWFLDWWVIFLEISTMFIVRNLHLFENKWMDWPKFKF